MGYFTQQTQVVRLDDDNTVTVRKLTYAEQQECISAALKVRLGDNNEMALDPALLRLEQVRRAVVSWEGPGFEGRPVNKTNVGALPTEVARQISDAVDALNAGLSDEEKN